MVHCTMPQMCPSRWLRAIKATFCSPVADIGSQCLDVRFGSLADIRARIRDVRFTPRSRHAHRWNQCLLSANSGHKAMLLSLPMRMVTSRQNRGVQHERNLGSMGDCTRQSTAKRVSQSHVWNRTATKMLPLVGVGTHGASSPAAAAQASPLILICVENYPVTKRIMGESDVIPHLSGKTIIQLSTGTPREAREAIQELWGYLYRWCHHGIPCRNRNAHYENLVCRTARHLRSLRCHNKSARRRSKIYWPQYRCRSSPGLSAALQAHRNGAWRDTWRTCRPI
jgi:NAD binding domain of 6-phosphogluconate dehydrogenase